MPASKRVMLIAVCAAVVPRLVPPPSSPWSLAGWLPACTYQLSDDMVAVDTDNLQASDV